ncbi:hypothetical protein HF086_004501, partial [Spodoptera exigua]
MAARNPEQNQPSTLGTRRPLNPDDDFYELLGTLEVAWFSLLQLSICPCEEESIQPPIVTYNIPGDKVQYEGAFNPDVFVDAAKSADKLVQQDIERAEQQTSDDDFSDTEPETAEIEIARVNIAEVKTAEVETAEIEAAEAKTAEVETAEHETSQVDDSVAGPSRLKQKDAASKAPDAITDLKYSDEPLDEEPQILLEKLIESTASQESKGNVDLVLNEEDEKNTKE